MTPQELHERLRLPPEITVLSGVITNSSVGLVIPVAGETVPAGQPGTITAFPRDAFPVYVPPEPELPWYVPRPIETAPQFLFVLVYVSQPGGEGNWTVAGKFPETGQWRTPDARWERFLPPDRVTHWMPTPPAPA